MTDAREDEGRSAASIERILAAAEQEFGDRGLSKVSIRSIAHRAGVSTQLIYHYFTRKEVLYAEALVRMTNRFFEKTEPIRHDPADPLATIHRFAFAYCEFYLKHPQTGRLILDQVLRHGGEIRRDHRAEDARERLLAELRKALETARAAGMVGAGVSAEGVFFHTLIVTLGYTTVSGLLERFHLDVPELVEGDDQRLRVANAVVGAIRNI